MAATHKCLVCSCSLNEGDNLRRRRRLDKCSQDLKNYIEMIELEHGSYDDPTYACRTCFSDIEKGAKTAVALQSINTRLENVRKKTTVAVSRYMYLDRHHSIIDTIYSQGLATDRNFNYIRVTG